MSQTKQKLHQHIEWLLFAAKSRNISQAEVSATHGQGLSITVCQKKPETIQYYQDQSIKIVVYCGHRKGISTTTDEGNLIPPRTGSGYLAKKCKSAGMPISKRYRDVPRGKAAWSAFFDRYSEPGQLPAVSQ